MKIATILHHIGRENPELFLKKLEEALLIDRADVIIGPDYSLNYDLSRPNTLEERDAVFSQIAEFCQDSEPLIIPGTMSYPLGEGMLHAAPVFRGGNLSLEFLKKRDNGESQLAERAGLTFIRGSNSGNRISLDGLTFAVEICGDHGTQDVRGCDVELILAYDKNAGFHVSAGNDGFARKAVVCDGYKPFASAFDYDPARNPRLISIAGEDISLKSGKVRLFEV